LTKKIAVYPGSFDPPTEGHLNLVKRGVDIFDQVIVAVAESTSKRYAFSPAERVALWKKLLKNVPRVRVETFSGLLVDYVETRGAKVIMRGLRNVTDFEYEIQMATTNRTLNKHLETVFIMTEGQYSHLASSLIKEIVLLGGSVKGMVPPLVERELKKKLGVHISTNKKAGTSKKTTAKKRGTKR
jgi:pantetheine-phosphate adenylyltransferase